ncbi:MAG: hypothetical protein L0Y66_04480 [Myxococcaceae bacterium]|nr:hypothetical protein [Myxococcaceae bacterium]MCI0671500.1 hypothetical protein [Myxococcaceae bacterium]
MNPSPSDITVVFGTPRKLPKPASLVGRVAVLDIAFAAGGGGSGGFEKVTLPFLRGLGERLAVWVDHHDHVKQSEYRDDARFVLSTKAEHGACPEMVTPELVARTGPVDTVLCHSDFDGLYSAAKWLRGGLEPYPGADDDARVVDTRVGTASALGQMVDRALRADPTDESIRHRLVRFLVGGARDESLRADLAQAAETFAKKEGVTRALAEHYVVHGRTALCDVSGVSVPAPGFDKTLLLLLGQERAQVAIVADVQSVTLATGYDSGINFLTLLGVTGGMPTVLSVPRDRLSTALKALAGAGLYTPAGQAR